ncbi:MAG: hypothetical protein ACRDNF_19405 [Streptosporangiaceae bacterium]
MTLSIRRGWLRGGASMAGVAVVAAAALVASSASAYADTTLKATYPVNGSTYIAAPGATLPLGPGKLAADVDLNTGAITATLTLPNATGSFKELGLIPVTATAQLINDGPTTGTLNLNTGAVQTTSNITMRLVSLSVAGIPIPVGSACQTSVPVVATLNSQPGFNVLKGGVVTGTYTIPAFANCGLATLLINLTLPGPNNTITLTLGKAKIKS